MKMFGLAVATSQLYDCTFNVRRRKTTNSRDLSQKVIFLSVRFCESRFKISKENEKRYKNVSYV